MNVLAHPLIKRLAIALPICIVVSLLRARFGEHSILVGFLVGIGSYFLADWILSTQTERKDRIQQVLMFLTANYWTLTKWVFYLALSLFFLNSLEQPNEPAVKQVFSLVEAVGFLVVVLLPAIKVTFNLSIKDATYSFTSATSGLLKGFARYSVALWIIGQVGDDIYTWALANPNDTVILGTSIVIIGLIAHFSEGYPANQGISNQFSNGFAVAKRDPVKPSARDNCHIAAHEAGHALVYAALGSLPEDLKLVINKSADKQGVLGFITAVRSEHTLNQKSFAEWYMLVLLAGKVGEKTAFGESTLGSSNDQARWLGCARSYLANHNRGIYFSNPQNKFEQEKNEEKLEALQREQLTMLEELFETNLNLHIQLTEQLLKSRSMDKKALTPFLSQVKLPEGFPVPF